MSDVDLMQAVESVIAQLEKLPDGPARELARQAMRAVLDLHREALARVLGTLRSRGETGAAVFDQMTRDPLLASVLSLHDLHPQDLNERIRGAIESVRPLLTLNGVTLRMDEVADGNVQVTLKRSAGCPSTANRMKSALEKALDLAAPDARNIQIAEERE